MKLKTFASVVVIILLTCIAGCILFDNDTDNPLPDMNFIYPLSVGSTWQYERVITCEYDPLATYNGFSDTSFYSTASVEIIDNEIIFDTLRTYNFKSILYEDSNVYDGNEYYNNVENGLINYGYTTPYMLTPKKNQGCSYLMFKGKKFNSIRQIIGLIEMGYYCAGHTKEDSIIFDQVRALEYPLEKGREWTYRTETYDGDPWRIDKKILDWKRIEVPAGMFNCWRIQWFNNPFGAGTNWDEDIFMLDYISEEGLIKRILELYNIQYYSAGGILLGYMNYTEETTLVDYTIE